MATRALLYLLSGTVVAALAPSGPWDAFNYAPSSRTVYPTAIYQVNGDVSTPDALLANGTGSSTISGSDSWISLDFGKEVGGLISLVFSDSSNGSLTLTFSESPSFVRPHFSDDSSYPSANTTYDGALLVSPIPSGIWDQPSPTLRGGFRYLTFAIVDGAATISNVSCEISFMPHVDDIRAYSGYFYAPVDEGYFHDTDFLTKLWYAGAYTVQTNTVPLHTGRQVPFASAGFWFNNATLGVAGPIIVDGAKRDRAVWPGDMGIAVPAQFVSTFDLIATNNALSTMFSAINPVTGALPESGPPLSQTGSDTYHAWTLIGTYNYYLYTENTTWLQDIWANYTKAVAFLEAKVDPAVGLMNVTGLRDWARQGGGGFNAEGNAILYRVLTTASSLSSYMNLPSLSTAYANNASALKVAFNNAFWVEDAGMFRDNTSTTLHPQDANSFAVLFNVTDDEAKKIRVSEGLMENWNDLGAVAPELPDTISPFIGGFEIQAHFEAGNTAAALELIKREWGYMLYTNLSVQSTMLEGFTANGSLYYRSNVGYNHDPAYTSHSHGWSAGPTSALTFYLLGLKVTAPQGKSWEVAPLVVENMRIPSAEGGFETGLGFFGVKWSLNSDTTLVVEIDTPEGTSGIFKAPEGMKIQNTGGKEVVDVSGGSVVLTVEKQ